MNTNALNHLRNEHQNINSLLHILERQFNSIKTAERPNYFLMQDIIRYLTYYFDHYQCIVKTITINSYSVLWYAKQICFIFVFWFHHNKDTKRWKSPGYPNESVAWYILIMLSEISVRKPNHILLYDTWIWHNHKKSDLL